jgi:hypothetical protein
MTMRRRSCSSKDERGIKLEGPIWLDNENNTVNREYIFERESQHEPTGWTFNFATVPPSA